MLNSFAGLTLIFLLLLFSEATCQHRKGRRKDIHIKQNDVNKVVIVKSALEKNLQKQYHNTISLAKEESLFKNLEDKLEAGLREGDKPIMSAPVLKKKLDRALQQEAYVTTKMLRKPNILRRKRSSTGSKKYPIAPELDKRVVVSSVGDGSKEFHTISDQAGQFSSDLDHVPEKLPIVLANGDV